MSAVTWIVGRRHVGESYIGVTRYVLSRLKGGRKAFRSWPRDKRRALVREIVQAHRDNRNLYRSVMSGQLSSPDSAAVLVRAARERMGFLSAEDVEQLVAGGDEQRPLLLRFYSGRVVVPAQLVTEAIKRWTERGDTLRDVSLLASDPIWERDSSSSTKVWPGGAEPGQADSLLPWPECPAHDPTDPEACPFCGVVGLGGQPCLAGQP